MPDATVAADPHPVVSQLSALHRFRIHLDIAVVVVVLVLTEPGRALHHAVGEHRHRPGGRCRPGRS